MNSINKKLLEIVNVIFVLTISVWGNPTCRTRFYTEIVCVAGTDDYILQRGLLSGNNHTVAITLKDCRITDVDTEAFKNIYNLEEIDLSRNKISYLKLGVLDGIPKLLSLRLSKNLLTTIPLGLFDNLPRLQRLDLSDNKIYSLESGLFKNLPLLIRLELSGNALLGKNLDPILFDPNPNLKFLHLSGNNMSGAPDQLLSAIRELKILGLNGCSLTEIPKFARGSNLKTLKTLLLQINLIKRLDDPAIFVHLENLETLDMYYNVIDNLNETVLKPLTKLRLIDLSFNKIAQIPEKMFQNMISVKSIDLSNNLIETLPVNIFQGSCLETLDLSGNRITYLERNFCSKICFFNKTLSTFYFKNNRFQCACLEEIINEVNEFGVKHDIDTYKEEQQGCSITSDDVCIRPEDGGNVIVNDEDKLWSTFGYAYFINSSNVF